MFLIGKEILWHSGVKTFLFFGFPIITAVYFLIAGTVFHRRLGLKPLILWLFMNVIGYPLCWIVLTILEPTMWFNLGMLSLIIPVTLTLLAVWSVMGIGFLVAWLFKRAQREKPPSTPLKRDFSKLKNILATIGLMLCVSTFCLAGVSAYNYFNQEPADTYIDEGIHEFKPYTVSPIQVKNTSSSGRDRRLNPTKTVYMVFYRVTDGNGYQWSTEVSSKSDGQKIVTQGEIVERRVLSIVDEGTYITIEPEYTAESYVSRNKTRYVVIFSVSVVYLAAFGFFLFKEQQKNRIKEGRI